MVQTLPLSTLHPVGFRPVGMIIRAILVALAVFCGSAHAARTLADDQSALTELYSTTGGNSTWRKSTQWLNTSSASSVCSWFGVTCGTASCLNTSFIPCRIVSLKLIAKVSLVGAKDSLVGAIDSLVGAVDSLVGASDSLVVPRIHWSCQGSVGRCQ